jgi:hypothetical protein
VIDRLLAAGSDLLVSGPLFFRFCCTQYNIHFRGFLLLLLLNFIMGRRASRSHPDRVTVCKNPVQSYSVVLLHRHGRGTAASAVLWHLGGTWGWNHVVVDRTAAM